MTSYQIPTEIHRTTLEVSNSRFITTVAPVDSAESAKEFIASIRAEMPDASHHVYAFRIGYGNSVIEGVSDDGEPSGTAGPPTLAVLRGTTIGDVVLVTTRYFGGTKLGTGGLVRSYGDAARLAFETLPIELKIEKQLVGIEFPYNYYDQVKRIITQHDALIEDETFAGEITIVINIPASKVSEFAYSIEQLTSGRVQPILLGSP